MAPPTTGRRLTREEQRAETRQRLMDAAEELFAASGIGQTSIEEIAEAAGFSRGAFYSNFEDRDALVFALLERHQKRSMEESHAIWEASDSAADFIGGLLERERSQPAQRATAGIEYVLYATRHPEGRAKMRELNEYLLEQMGWFAERQLDQPGQTPALTGREAAKILLALDEGFAILRLTDPEAFPAGIWGETVALLNDAIMALQAQRAQ